MNVAQPIEWTSRGVVILDQRRLPGEVIRHTYTDYRDVAAAIKDMVIRGAPAHGRGLVLGRRAYDSPLRAARSREDAARRAARRDGRGSARNPCGKTRHRRSDGPLRSGLDARSWTRDDAVQRWRSGYGRHRLGAGRDSRGRGAGAQTHPADAGDAALS